jgi:hypothetical protein
MLLFMLIVPVRLNVPAGTRTKVPAGADVIAELTFAIVTLPPETVLHWEVTHCVRVGGVQGLGVVSPSGKVAGSPDVDQSMARLAERTPAQF